MPDTKANLLVVDDEPSNRLSLACLLMQLGYRVRTAEDGFSALIKIGEEVPDILLSDLHMPGMSGFELLATALRQFPGVHTIAMSGAFSGDEVPRGVSADAFYRKGSGVELLLEKIETLSQRLRMRVDAAAEWPANEEILPLFQPALAGPSPAHGATETINC